MSKRRPQITEETASQMHEDVLDRLTRQKAGQTGELFEATDS